jgi:DNA-binding FadR family transcriptional regulator
MTPNSEPTPEHSQTEPTTVERCVEALFGDVLDGRYLRGARLPSERELSVALGASRVSVRQALQRLFDWGVIGVRRGSGTVVRDQRTWSLPVLPSVVRFWLRRGDKGTLFRYADQLLELRRILFGSVMRAAARRLSGRKLDLHRRAIEEGWTLRDRPAVFAQHELTFVRGLLADAHMEPATWLLNTMAGVYVELAVPMVAVIPTPDDHRTTYLAYLDHVERGQPDEAANELDAFMARYDEAVLAHLDPRSVSE